MKAEGFKNTDLMTGDLVEYRNVYLRITSVLDSNVMTEFGPYGLDEIEPISITPRILEKNGFKKLGCTNIYQFLWGKIMCCTISFSKDMNTNYGYYVRGEVTSLHSDIVPYVHELQHAMRLCGIDKEIVL